MNKITILGSGSSTGVPILGCNCRVCKSTEVRNKRLRSSSVIKTQKDKTILIDASPDLRTQLLREGIENIDAAVITHDHADHTHGIDDLRPFGYKSNSSIPIYTHREAAQSLRNKFPYIFNKEIFWGEKPILGGGIPQLHIDEIEPGKNKVLDESFDFFLLPHGHTESLALRHGKMGYVIDCNRIDKDVLESFRNAQLEILVLDCLRLEPHSTHLHLDLALEYISYISPRTTLLTHLGHEWDYHALIGELKARNVNNILPAIDGMTYLYS